MGSLVKGFPTDQIGEGFQLYYDWLNSLVTHEDITREIFVESPIANPCAAFRRSWIRDLGGYRDHGWPEDYDLWLRFFLAGAGFAKIPEVLLEWREHPERLTHQDSRYSVENFLRAKAHYIAQGPAQGSGRRFRVGRRHDRTQIEQTPGEGRPATGRFRGGRSKEDWQYQARQADHRGWGPDGSVGKVSESDPADSCQGKIRRAVD